GERAIASVSPVEAAGAGQVAFVAGRKAAELAAGSAAGCLIVPVDFLNATGRTVIRSQDPRASFARTVSRFHPPPHADTGVHPTAVIAGGVELGEGVTVRPHTFIGDGPHIGKGHSIDASEVRW